MDTMMILAFDTALGACSVGLWTQDRIIAHESVVMVQGHAEALMPMIERVMALGHKTYADLDRIAVTVGPGSFTGLRVGIATARGLAMAAQKPAIGVTTTSALASALSNPEKQTIIAAIDSKRGDVFAQAFHAHGHALGGIVNIGYDRLQDWCPDGPLTITGDAAARACEHLGPRAKAAATSSICDIAVVARLAAAQEIDPHGPIPVYARPPDVTLSPGGGHLRP